MPETVQINFRVDADQKDRWEDYVNETGKFSTLTGLIRASVESEIADEGETSTTPDPSIATDVTELSQTVDEIRKDVSWIRRQHQEDVDIGEIAQEVFDSLETLPSPRGEVDVPESVDMDRQTYIQHRGAESVVTPENSDEEPKPQTVDAIADRLGMKPGRVDDALEHLQEQFLPVVEVELNGRRHYFKEG